MPEFIYSAQDGKGRRFTGRMDADSREGAMKILSGKYEVVVRVEPASGGGILGARLSTEDLVAFTLQTSAMLNSGISLKRALELVVEESPSAALRSAAVDIAATVTAGGSLSEALGQHPGIFDAFYIGMVRAGEASGDLAGALRRNARQLERAHALREKVKASLYYPGMVAGVGVLVVAFIIVAAVPRLEAVYKDLGTNLPLGTQVLLSVSTALASTWMIWVPLLVLLAIALGILKKQEPVALAIDRWTLRTPGLVTLFRTIAASRYARTLADLNRSGVPILEAMDLAANTAGNREITRQLRTAIAPVREGLDLAAALKNTQVLPPMAVGMAAAGQEAGRLDEMLEAMADYYDTQTEIRLTALAGMIEPAVMVFIGVSIGTVVALLALPFLNIAAAIR